MTAEIGVLNKHAVALAADSAVTIRTQNGRKIYNSVNKLFTLSKYHPVGIMIYGSADLCDVPWETIIKEYRRKLGKKKFSTIALYAEDFIRFINSKPKFFSLQDVFFEHSLESVYRRIVAVVNKNINNRIDNGLAVLTKDVAIIVKETVLRFHVELLREKDLTCFSSTFSQKLSSTYKSTINSIWAALFEQLPLDTPTKRKLVEIGKCVVLKDVFYNYSGVVIAGFGEAEIFPALISFKTDGVICDELRYKEERSSKIGNDHAASILPFAQSDMVRAFMEGIDPSLGNVINGFLEEVFEKYPSQILEHIEKHIPKDQLKKIGALDTISSSILNEFRTRLREYQQSRFIIPIVQSVALLPKEELAIMAENLVNLTSFKQKISVNDAETVGGAIDVAIISKGDGFIWIKRKHYFNPEINSRFFKNYHHENNEE